MSAVVTQYSSQSQEPEYDSYDIALMLIGLFNGNDDHYDSDDEGLGPIVDLQRPTAYYDAAM